MPFRNAMRVHALLIVGLLVAGTGGSAAADVQRVAEAPPLVAPPKAPSHDHASHDHPVAVETRPGTLAPDHADPAPAGVDVHRQVPTSELRPAWATRGEQGRELVLGRAAAARSGDRPALTEAANKTPAGTSALPHLTNHVPRSCAGNGTDGNRVQALYVVEADDPDRLSSVLPMLRDEIANIDDTFALSAAETGGSRRVRWVFNSPETCEPTITKVVVPAGSLATFPASVSAMRAAGYISARRKYLAFTDAAFYCGVGHIYRDDRRSGNANDGGSTAMFARVDTGCWQTTSSHGSTAAHELMHTIGGVQQSAPHVTPLGHCTDRYDLMCYDDGSGAIMTKVCPTEHGPLFDCNNDDYFNTSPSAGSYLATFWNSADSSFLDAGAIPAPPAPVPSAGVVAPVSPVAPAPPVPTDPVPAASVTVTGPGTLLPGLAGRLVATASGSGAFAWSTSDPDCVDGSTTSAVLNIRCSAHRAGSLVATVTFTGADGRGATASHVVSPSAVASTLTALLAASSKSVPRGAATTVTARLLLGQLAVRGRLSVAASTDRRSWRVLLADVDTGSDGVVVFSARPSQRTYLRLTTSVAVGSGWSVRSAPVLRLMVTRAAAIMSITVSRGTPTRITGRLTTTLDPQGVANRAVALQYRTRGASRWRTLRILTTNRAGRVSTIVEAARGSYYRWHYAGSSADLPDRSSAASTG